MINAPIPIGGPATTSSYFGRALDFTSSTFLLFCPPASLRSPVTVAPNSLPLPPQTNTSGHGFNCTLRARRKAVCSLCRLPSHLRRPSYPQAQYRQGLLGERYQYVFGRPTHSAEAGALGPFCSFHNHTTHDTRTHKQARK